MQILVVNPGATSTKIAVFSNEDPIAFVIRSDDAETKPSSSIALAAVVSGV